MALPKIQLPLFEITIPSTGKKTKFRPFTVKEEKILLIAQESKDTNQVILAIKQIINNCVEDVDVDNLATFDLEYLLLQVRAKSVNDILNFGITDPDTQESVELAINVDDIKIHTKEGHNKKIKLNDEYVMLMRYPTIDKVRGLGDATENRTQKLFEVMISCIDTLATEEDVYKMDDFTAEEVNDFVESLSNAAIQEIQKFFETMPTLRYEAEYTNKNGDKKTFVLEGTETFFM